MTFTLSLVVLIALRLPRRVCEHASHFTISFVGQTKHQRIPLVPQRQRTILESVYSARTLDNNHHFINSWRVLM
jgi:hypothetical protein